VTCVGIGSNLISRELIQKKDWEGLRKRVAGAVKIAKMFQKI
jgi:2-dehydro-3-deoxyphosphogluconate aldolase/(4S)-4-hydroxy-2-oxoglutarate aldolase